MPRYKNIGILKPVRIIEKSLLAILYAVKNTMAATMPKIANPSFMGIKRANINMPAIAAYSKNFEEPVFLTAKKIEIKAGNDIEKILI